MIILVSAQFLLPPKCMYNIANFFAAASLGAHLGSGERYAGQDQGIDRVLRQGKIACVFPSAPTAGSLRSLGRANPYNNPGK